MPFALARELVSLPVRSQSLLVLDDRPVQGHPKHVQTVSLAEGQLVPNSDVVLHHLGEEIRLPALRLDPSPSRTGRGA